MVKYGLLKTLHSQSHTLAGKVNTNFFREEISLAGEWFEKRLIVFTFHFIFHPNNWWKNVLLKVNKNSEPDVGMGNFTFAVMLLPIIYTIHLEISVAYWIIIPRVGTFRQYFNSHTESNILKWFVKWSKPINFLSSHKHTNKAKY